MPATGTGYSSMYPGYCRRSSWAGAGHGPAPAPAVPLPAPAQSPLGAGPLPGCAAPNVAALARKHRRCKWKGLRRTGWPGADTGCGSGRAARVLPTAQETSGMSRPGVRRAPNHLLAAEPLVLEHESSAPPTASRTGAAVPRQRDLRKRQLLMTGALASKRVGSVCVRAAKHRASLCAGTISQAAAAGRPRLWLIPQECALSAPALDTWGHGAAPKLITGRTQKSSTSKQRPGKPASTRRKKLPLFILPWEG